MNNCTSCYTSCPDNACATKFKTWDCNPNSKSNWFKYNSPIDQVRSNIYYGCWLCNYEPRQTQNNLLCQRNFSDHGIIPPYNRIFSIEQESQHKIKKF